MVVGAKVWAGLPTAQRPIAAAWCQDGRVVAGWISIVYPFGRGDGRVPANGRLAWGPARLRDCGETRVSID